MSTPLNVHKLKVDEYRHISLIHPKERRVIFCLSRWKKITFRAKKACNKPFNYSSVSKQRIRRRLDRKGKIAWQGSSQTVLAEKLIGWNEESKSQDSEKEGPRCSAAAQWVLLYVLQCCERRRLQVSKWLSIGFRAR